MYKEIVYSELLHDVIVYLHIDTIIDNGKVGQRTKLTNFGYIEIVFQDAEKSKDKNNPFWDNLNFFIESTLKQIKKECKEELKDKGYFVPGIWKSIQALINEAIKDGVLITRSKQLYDEGGSYRRR